jgi:hypothetical protein
MSVNPSCVEVRPAVGVDGRQHRFTVAQGEGQASGHRGPFERPAAIAEASILTATSANQPANQTRPIRPVAASASSSTPPHPSTPRI